MAIKSDDIVPLNQVRARLTELAEEVRAGAEKIITRNGESYVALVTGASRGIGEATLQALARAGATVVGTSTTEKGAQGITQALTAAGGKGGRKQWVSQIVLMGVRSRGKRWVSRIVQIVVGNDACPRSCWLPGDRAQPYVR